MKPKHPLHQVHEFMSTFGQATPKKAKLPAEKIRDARHIYLDEENVEAIAAESLTDYADAICDQLYIVYGNAVAAGIDADTLDKCFAEVHRSNMSKMWTRWETGVLTPEMKSGLNFKRIGDRYVVTRKSDGKIIKSPSYSKAELGPILKGKK